jgi:hypothetical protein
MEIAAPLGVVVKQLLPFKLVCSETSEFAGQKLSIGGGLGGYGGLGGGLGLGGGGLGGGGSGLGLSGSGLGLGGGGLKVGGGLGQPMPANRLPASYELKMVPIAN